jgi:hypothetical protein
MKQRSTRIAAAATALTFASAAQAAETTYAGMTAGAWGSILAVVGIVVILVWVYKKTN